MSSSPVMAKAKLGRNDPCFCGSGKKFKACCLNQSSDAPTNTVPSLSDTLKQAWQAVAKRDVAGTLHWFRAALQLAPNNAEALAGLGQALCWQQQRREGLEYLQKAAQILEAEAQQKHALRFILELAEQLHFWGDLHTALRLTALALHLEPANPMALNNHALYLTRLNRHQEALPYAEKVCALLPDEPACNNMLAIIDTHLKRYAAAKQRLEKIVQANRDVQQTARALQELVGVLDKTGEYNASFAACEQAKALYRQFPEVKNFSTGQIFNAIACNKAGFDAALLQRWHIGDFEDQLPVPVFLLGFLRSGTTLTEQVLGAHAEVITSDENDLVNAVENEIRRWTNCGENISAGLAQLDLVQIKSLRQLYWHRVAEEYGQEALTKCFIDKVALNSVNVGMISFLFPEAKIIFALRDPRDVCLSCFQQVFKPSNVTVNMLSWEGIAKQYAAVMDFWLYVKDLLQSQYIEIRYEDTVNEFEASIQRIFDLLDLAWSDEVLEFHEKAKGRYIATPSFAAVTQPVYKGSLARWRHYAAHYTPILPIIDRYIDAFGYR